MTAEVLAIDVDLDEAFLTPLDLAIDTAERLERFHPADNHGRTMKAVNAVQLDAYIRARSCSSS